MSEAKFNKAVSIVQSLPKDGTIKPTQEEQLVFYKYYKQATVGDVNIPKPGMFDFVGKAKWDAWKSVENTSKEDAQKAYVDAFVAILKKSPDDADSQKYLAEIEAA